MELLFILTLGVGFVGSVFYSAVFWLFTLLDLLLNAVFPSLHSDSLVFFQVFYLTTMVGLVIFLVGIGSEFLRSTSALGCLFFMVSFAELVLFTLSYFGLTSDLWWLSTLMPIIQLLGVACIFGMLIFGPIWHRDSV